MNAALYALTVLIWGTTWIAISIQSEFTTPTVGVFWRTGIAAVILLSALTATGRLRKIRLKDHLFCIIQGATVFGANFLCFYSAAQYVNSGLECVIFSTAIFFNAINSWIFLRARPSKQFIPATILGFSGIALLFWHDIFSNTVGGSLLQGVFLCLLGTFAFSLGNIVSARHQRLKLDVMTTTSYSLGYAAILMLALSVARGDDLIPSTSALFLISLAHLAIFGSVVGFTAYFSLVGRIGAANAAYATLLFPLVALTISTLFEGFQWTLSAALGVILISTGNLILFRKPKTA